MANWMTIQDAADLCQRYQGVRERRRQWGDWRYVKRLNVLICRTGCNGYEYEVDLDRCKTSAAVLDWIMQVHTKTWATPKIIRDFLTAIRDRIDPQATLCSGGLL